MSATSDLRRSATTGCASGSIPTSWPARHDGRRGRRGAARAERAGRRAADRPAADADGQAFQSAVSHAGASPTRAVRGHHRQDRRRARRATLATSAASSSAGADYEQPDLNGKPAVRIAIFQLPGSNALATAEAHQDDDGGAETRFPKGVGLQQSSTTRRVHRRVDQRGLPDARSRPSSWCSSSCSCSSRTGAGAHPDARHPGVAGRHVRGHGGAGLLAQQPLAVRPGAGDRHRGGRRDRGGRERRAPPGAGLSPRRRHQAMDEVGGPVIAIALVLCAVFVPTAFMAGITGQFFRQFALTIAVSTLISAFNSLTLSPALRLACCSRPNTPPVEAGISAAARHAFFEALQPGNSKVATMAAPGYSSRISAGDRCAACRAAAAGRRLGCWFTRAEGLHSGAGPGYCHRAVQLPVPRRRIDAPRGAGRDRECRAHAGHGRGPSRSPASRRDPHARNAAALPGVSRRSRERSRPAGSRRRHRRRVRKRAVEIDRRAGSSVVIRRPPCPASAPAAASTLRCRTADRRPGAARCSRRRPLASQRHARAGAPSSRFQRLPRRHAAALRRHRRTKAQKLGVPIERRLRHAADLPRLGLRQRLQPLRPHLAGDRAGRPPFRLEPDDIASSRCATPTGEMVPLGTLFHVPRHRRPDDRPRYNLYPPPRSTAARPGVSSGQAIAAS